MSNDQVLFSRNALSSRDLRHFLSRYPVGSPRMIQKSGYSVSLSPQTAAGYVKKTGAQCYTSPASVLRVIIIGDSPILTKCQGGGCRDRFTYPQQMKGGTGEPVPRTRGVCV